MSSDYSLASLLLSISSLCNFLEKKWKRSMGCSFLQHLNEGGDLEGGRKIARTTERERERETARERERGDILH